MAKRTKKHWRIAIAAGSSSEYDVVLRYSGAPTQGKRFSRKLPPKITFTADAATEGTQRKQRKFRKAPDALETEDEVFFNAGNLAALEDIGHKLFESLFDTDRDTSHLASFRTNYEIAKDKGEYFNIWIDCKAATGLAGVPWEAIYDRENDNFLAADTTANIVRALDPDFAGGQPQEVDGPIRVLLAIANPEGDLKTDEELTRIQTKLDELLTGAQRGNFELKIRPKVTRVELSDDIRFWKPHIVHFVGHGGFEDEAGMIFLHDEEDPTKAWPVDSDTLRQMVRSQLPWLVVLNSCSGGMGSRIHPFSGAAQNLRRVDVPFVIAMQYPISDGVAIRFSERLYGELATGTPVVQAVSSARSVIYEMRDQADKVELMTPVLYATDEYEGLPPPIAAGGGDAADEDDGDETPPTASGRPDWLGKAAKYSTVLALPVALFFGLQQMGVFDFDSAPSPGPTPTPSGAVTPAPTPSPTNDGVEEEGPDVGEMDVPPPPMPSVYYGDGREYSGYDSNPTPAYYLCDDGSMPDEYGECPPPIPISQPYTGTVQNAPPDPRGDIAPRYAPPGMPPPPEPRIVIPESASPAPLENCPEQALIVFFRPGSDELSPQVEQQLDFATSEYSNCPSVIGVAGHADTSGTLSESQALSERRAAAVQSYLIERGVAAQDVFSEAFGETEPLVMTADGVVEIQNNRVVLSLTASGPSAAALHDQMRASLEIRMTELVAERNRDAGNALHPLLTDGGFTSYYQASLLLEQEAAAVLNREALRNNATNAEYEVGRDELSAMMNRVADLRTAYYIANEQRLALLSTELGHVMETLHAQGSLYLEITVPYQPGDDALAALCRGYEMRDALLASIEEAAYDGATNSIRLDTTEACGDPLPFGWDENAQSTPIYPDYATHPITPDRVEVRIAERIYEAPTYGALPLGARPELRLRLRGVEAVPFTPRSAQMTGDGRDTIGRLADWHGPAERATEGPTDALSGALADTPAYTLIFESPVDPANLDDGSQALAAARLRAIRGQLEVELQDGAIVRILVCQAPWSEIATWDDWANSAVEIAIERHDTQVFLDHCVPASQGESVLGE